MKNSTPKNKNNKLLIFLKKYFIWLAIFEVIIIFTLSWLFLIQGAYFSLTDAKKPKDNSPELLLNQKQQELASLEKLQADYQQLNQERLQYALQILPAQIEPTLLISRLESFAQAAKINMTSIDVSQNAAGATDDKNAKPAQVDNPADEQSVSFANKNIGSTLITMNVELQDKSYAGVKNFLASLSSFTPVLELSSLTYAEGTNNFGLQLRTYYLISPDDEK